MSDNDHDAKFKRPAGDDSHEGKPRPRIDARLAKSVKFLLAIWATLLSAMASYVLFEEYLVAIDRKIFEYVSQFPPFLNGLAAVLGGFSIIFLVREVRLGTRIVDAAKEFLSLKNEVSAYEPEPNQADARVNTNNASIGNIDKRFKDLIDKISAIENNKIDIVSLNQDEIDNLKKDAISRTSNLISDEIAKYLKQKIRREEVDSISESSLVRLSRQLIALGSRANSVLVTGIIFCSAGLAALWYSFYYSPVINTSSEWVELFKSYAPRLALVLLIEIIGFFFLKMYRATLVEIRYVQNEITNVELRLIALFSARAEGGATLSKVIEALAKTDRNSVIEKGQTTVEIERHRATSEADKSILEAAVALVHGTRKGSFWRSS
jgi:hypothetical protein